jgi:hypothetical protein
MGSQGIPPLHPELLDHLSWRFMHVHHWSVKALLRDIVLSATYSQDSRVSAALLEKDPRNEWLARGPRVRLSAEQLRDKALAVAGKLSAKMYGPGVMPFQPEGIWKSPWNGDQWKQSTGDDQYRRAIYTFVKRSSPYPSAVTFDLAPREVCASRRIRTNTPLQALVTLNDSVFLEAARFLADTIQKQPHLDEKGRITTVYERATGWKITPSKLQALEKLHQQASTYFSQNPEAVAAFMGNKISGDTQAALTVVANAVLNLDEFLVKS